MSMFDCDICGEPGTRTTLAGDVKVTICDPCLNAWGDFFYQTVEYERAVTLELARDAILGSDAEAARIDALAGQRLSNQRAIRVLATKWLADRKAEWRPEKKLECPRGAAAAKKEEPC